MCFCAADVHVHAYLHGQISIALLYLAGSDIEPCVMADYYRNPCICNWWPFSSARGSGARMILGSCHKSARAEPRAARSHGRNLACRVTNAAVRSVRARYERKKFPGSMSKTTMEFSTKYMYEFSTLGIFFFHTSYMYVLMF